MGFSFKTKPYDFQVREFKRTKDEKTFAYFWEMGAGKTKMGIDLCRYIFYQHKEVKKTLIVGPLIVLYNWLTEFEIHSNLKQHVTIIRGDEKKKKLILSDPHSSIFLINYDAIVGIEAALLKKKFDVIILDESHYIKNNKAQRAKAMVRIGWDASYKFILSGTPVLNNLLDIFMQFLFLDNGETFGKNFYSFRNKYFKNENEGTYNRFGKYVPRPGTLEELQRLLQKKSSIIYKKDVMKFLPPKVYQNIFCQMGGEQSRIYSTMAREYIAYVKDHADYLNDPTVANNAATKIIRLNQITAGFIKTESGEELWIGDSKIKALLEILESIKGSKVVIWTVFTKTIHKLQEVLKEYDPCLLYSGIKDRQKEIDKFYGPSNILIGQASTGIGINLTCAKYAIYYSQTYNLGHRLQSEDRTHRGGSQVHDSIGYFDLLHENKIDHAISEALKKKENMKNEFLKIAQQLEGHI